MLVEKVFTATIDVRDPEDFCALADAQVVSYLRRRFAGKNRGGSQIVDIIAVERRSDCRIKETDLSGEGYVDVEFRALVMVLGQWDIVTGVKVVSRGQLIVGQSQVEGAVVVSLMPSPEAETVRVDQIVAARVLRAQFAPDQPQATAVGPLLTCDRAAPAYILSADLTRDDARDLESLVAQIRTLLEARAALMETRRDDVLFFESLLYSYALRTRDGAPQTVETPHASDWVGPPGVPLGDGAESVNLVALVAEAKQKGSAPTRGTWCRDLALYRSSPLAARSGSASQARWGNAVATTPRVAFAGMLKTTYDFLKAVNEMVDIYDSAELIEDHKNVWLAMRGAQLPPPS